MLIDDETTNKIISFLLACIGSLLLFGGGLISYIFIRHVHENDCKFDKNERDHEKFSISKSRK